MGVPMEAAFCSRTESIQNRRANATSLPLEQALAPNTMGEPAKGVPVGYPPNASPYTSYSTQPPSYASLQQAQPAQSSAAEKAVASTCAPPHPHAMHFQTSLLGLHSPGLPTNPTVR
jgi:hypothetical protein